MSDCRVISLGGGAGVCPSSRTSLAVATSGEMAFAGHGILRQG